MYNNNLIIIYSTFGQHIMKDDTLHGYLIFKSRVSEPQKVYQELIIPIFFVRIDSKSTYIYMDHCVGFLFDQSTLFKIKWLRTTALLDRSNLSFPMADTSNLKQQSSTIVYL